MQQNHGHRPTLRMSSPRQQHSQATEHKGFTYPGKKRVPGSQRALSHEKDLKRAKESGELIKVVLASEVVATGVIKDYDKYTIKIDCGKYGVVTYFKHAIEAFQLSSEVSDEVA